MAGELIVIVSHQASVGVRLEFARDFSDAKELLAPPGPQFRLPSQMSFVLGEGRWPQSGTCGRKIYGIEDLQPG